MNLHFNIDPDKLNPNERITFEKKGERLDVTKEYLPESFYLSQRNEHHRNEYNRDEHHRNEHNVDWSLWHYFLLGLLLYIILYATKDGL